MEQLRPRPGAERDRRPVHGDDDLSTHAITQVGEQDLADLLPLLRAYCDFYEVAPSDERLLALCRALIDGPGTEGVQLLARQPGGQAVGFATIYWSWQTLAAARLAVMNDLYVDPAARGSGVADALIRACARAALEHGAHSLGWQTALDNARAQAVYNRVGGQASRWLDYELVLEGSTAPSWITQPE